MGGSHEIRKLQNLQILIAKHFAKFKLSNEDDLQLYYISLLMEALEHFNLNGDLDSAYGIVEPIIEGYAHGKKINEFLDIIILNSCIIICKSYLKVDLIVVNLFRELKVFKDNPSYERLLASINTNYATRLLHVKYFEQSEREFDRTTFFKSELQDLFEKSIQTSLKLCVENHWDAMYASIMIRVALFYRNKYLLNMAMLFIERNGLVGQYETTRMMVARYTSQNEEVN